MAERWILALWLGWAGAVWAQGAIDAFEFDAPADAQRYQALIDEFRCPKCLNTNLSGSDAPIAADLRAVVYRLVREGKSNAEVRSYLQTRYGDFVLYDPPVRADTVALWAVPLLLAIVGVVIIVGLARRRRALTATLDDDAQARLAALLAEDAPR